MDKPTITNCPKCGHQLTGDLSCPNGHGNFGPKQLTLTSEDNKFAKGSL